ALLLEAKFGVGMDVLSDGGPLVMEAADGLEHTLGVHRIMSPGHAALVPALDKIKQYHKQTRTAQPRIALRQTYSCALFVLSFEGSHVMLRGNVFINYQTGALFYGNNREIRAQTQCCVHEAAHSQRNAGRHHRARGSAPHRSYQENLGLHQEA